MTHYKKVINIVYPAGTKFHHHIIIFDFFDYMDGLFQDL